MKNSEDLNFVNILHSQKNAKIDSKVLLLFFTILVFFIGAFVWAYFSKIDELTRGEGKVIPSEKIKTIQSLDGGLISEILIKEGSIIKEGQPLMKIDTTRFEASLEENKQTYYHLLVTKARLDVESKLDLDEDIPQINYSEEVLQNAKIFAMNDRKLFTSRVEELKSTVKTFKIQLKQKEQEINELNSKSHQLRRSIALVREEASTMEQLVARKSKSKVDLLKIKKELAQLEGDLQNTYVSIPRAKYAIEEAKNKIVEKSKTFRAEASNELQKINTEIKKYESKLVSDEDKLDKTVLVSPVDGIVKQINVNTIGGVVKSGMELIEIVPQSDILLVEAKIDPKDIAFINPQQRAIVKITAYDFSIYGGLEGQIVEISADSIVDKNDKNQKSYYKVVIKTERNYLEKNKQKLPIIPGMITTVDIITGKKSILDFIMKPILKTKANALHER
jgi:membrane fusion protein, adhesin transport system